MKRWLWPWVAPPSLGNHDAEFHSFLMGTRLVEIKLLNNRFSYLFMSNILYLLLNQKMGWDKSGIDWNTRPNVEVWNFNGVWPQTQLVKGSRDDIQNTGGVHICNIFHPRDFVSSHQLYISLAYLSLSNGESWVKLDCTYDYLSVLWDLKFMIHSVILVGFHAMQSYCQRIPD
jgi:hypothetical protein